MPPTINIKINGILMYIEIGTHFIRVSNVSQIGEETPNMMIEFSPAYLNNLTNLSCCISHNEI